MTGSSSTWIDGCTGEDMKKVLKGGDVRNITFDGGAVYSKGKKSIQLYYRAADTHVAGIDVDVDSLIENLTE